MSSTKLELITTDFLGVCGLDHRKVIPPHFLAYLEKHRIYELFYDMASSLAVSMPNDHVLFLRNYLVDVAANRDKSKIMIIGPPFIDKKSIAKAVGHLLKLPVISLCDITKGDAKYYKNPELLASKFKELLYSTGMEDGGWVLYDFPRDRMEVAALQNLGIRPSHAFQLIPSPQNVADRELWDEHYVEKPIKELTKYAKEYRRRLTGLRPSVKNVLREVPLHKRDLETIARNMTILGRQSNHSGGPMLPRVVIIGTRGSFKRTIACKMAEELGVIHVNMEEIISQALQKDNKLGESLRELSDRNVRLYGKLVVAVLEDRLLDYDCLNKGWVLTGFPRDSKDLAVLDMFDTPPNRVIFITNNSLEALERLTNRRINIYTGEYKHKDDVEQIEDIVVKDQFVVHPDDELLRVMRERQEFDENIQGMLDYCNGNCIIVDGSGGLGAVTQRIFKSTLQASPPAEIRTSPVEHQEAAEEQEREIEETLLAPSKSLFATSKDRTQLKVEFSPVTDTVYHENISKRLETADSTKAVCLETSLSGLKESDKQQTNVVHETKVIEDYYSCTSIFPKEIQQDWGKVRNKAKSYLSIPSMSIDMNKKCLN